MSSWPFHLLKRELTASGKCWRVLVNRDFVTLGKEVHLLMTRYSLWNTYVSFLKSCRTSCIRGWKSSTRAVSMGPEQHCEVFTGTTDQWLTHMNHPSYCSCSPLWEKASQFDFSFFFFFFSIPCWSCSMLNLSGEYSTGVVLWQLFME